MFLAMVYKSFVIIIMPTDTHTQKKTQKACTIMMSQLPSYTAADSVAAAGNNVSKCRSMVT